MAEELVSLVDVVPTIQDVCGLVDDGIRAEIETRSLCGARRSERSFVVAENERPVNGDPGAPIQLPGGGPRAHSITRFASSGPSATS